MESLPNSFFQQEPVVFFSAGPPTENFRHGHEPRSHYGRCGGGPSFDNRRHNQNGFSFNFLKAVAMGILTLFALSMLARLFFLLVAVLFSPPVLLLCLFFLVINQGWHQHYTNQYWNAREFQQCFRNPRRFRRFFNDANRYANNGFGSGRSCEGRGTRGSATRRPPTASQPPSTPAAPTNTQPAPDSPPDTPDAAHDFELISPFNLMMAAAAAAEGANNTAKDDGAPSPSGTSTNEAPSSDSSPARPQYQKVPVHRNETDDALTIAMDISGFDVKNINITVENDTLCIRGERTNKIGDSFIVEEFFELDKETFDEESVQANATDGVLEVKVSKKAAPEPRVISISTEEDKKEE